MADSDKNNGLITKIWGPELWTSMHCISFGYPLEPTDEHKTNYKNYFTLVGDILPCKYCRESYKEFIVKDPLTDDVMKNRENLTRWLYRIHNKVNDKLETEYGIEYEDVVARYESYRAKCAKKPSEHQKGCLVPLDKKADAYKYSQIQDCPIISLELAKKFIPYAKKRGLGDDDFKYINAMSKDKFETYMKDKRCDIWCQRNKECKELINKMRIDGIPMVESDEQYKGLPTISELQLIMRLSSNLTKSSLEGVANLLDEKIKSTMSPIQKNTKSNIQSNKLTSEQVPKKRRFFLTRK